MEVDYKLIIKLLQIANRLVKCPFSSATRFIFSRNNSPPSLQQLTQVVLYTVWCRNEDMNEIRMRMRVVKTRNKIIPEILGKHSQCLRYIYVIIAIVSCINIRWVPREVLETSTFGLGFQHLPQDPANVNAGKHMFDPYIISYSFQPPVGSRKCSVTL